MAESASAEYRVFVLKIGKRGGTDSRLVTSTLDPEQYRGFYPVGLDEDITYIQTWRCFGRTGDFEDFCPNPKAQNAAPTAPAS